MKLCVQVLLLALGVSGDKCHESNECQASDINSQLHLATKTTEATEVTKESVAPGTYYINEFFPFKYGGNNPVELRGPGDGADFGGCVWSLLTDFGAGPDRLLTVDSVIPVFSFFVGNGLVGVDPGPLLKPRPDSFAIFLTKGCPDSGLNLNITGEAAQAFGQAQQIYDSIWLPEDAPAVPELQGILDAIRARVASLAPGASVPGTVLGWSGARPELVFRDGSNPALLYQVQEYTIGPLFDASGMEVNPGAFTGGNPVSDTYTAPNPVGPDPGVMGDPHIHTMDGGQYTLLREGSFLLWRFGLPQPHVEWQIFAHYAGRQSFTKGLLLVDTSGSEPSSMEITSEHCEWQTQSSSKNWSSINSEAPEVLLSNPSSRMKLVGNQRKDVKKIHLFIADEKVPVATLKVMCRQGRHINMKLHMENQKWASFVSGELKGQKGQTQMPSGKTSMLQLVTSEDDDFEVKKTWAQLGGSSHAQQYLQNLDEHPSKLIFSQMCDPQAQADARALCQKHLGTVAHSSYLEECVYDVCAGGGEVAAEMTAEMLKF